MDPCMELKKNMDELTEKFTAKMTAFEASISLMETVDMNLLTSEFNTFKSLIWKTVSNIKLQLQFVFKCLDGYETKSRVNMLLLHGEPENNNEDVSERVVNICHYKLQMTDISKKSFLSCTRLGKTITADKSRPILLQFIDLQDRYLMWTNKSKLKGSGLTVSEFLTAIRHTVFVEARNIYGVKGCWTCDGKIVLLCPDGIRRKIIFMDELGALQQGIKNDPTPTGTSSSNEATVSVVEKTHAQKTRTCRTQSKKH